MRSIPLLVAAISMVLASSLRANDPAAGIPPKIAFEALKSLAGTWTGTVTARETGPAVTVIYTVIAAGSAVEERLFPGTSHEMVTMYHMDGDRLVLTHYCAAGNQPHMMLAPESTASCLVFNFQSATNLASPDAMHMHNGRMTFADADTIEVAWDVFSKGAKTGENLFFLKRTK